MKQEIEYNYWSDFSKQEGVESIAEVERGWLKLGALSLPSNCEWQQK